METGSGCGCGTEGPPNRRPKQGARVLFPRQIGDFIGGGSFLSVGPQAIAKYLKYFAFLGSRPGTNHALAEKESSKAKPRLVTIFEGVSGYIF